MRLGHLENVKYHEAKTDPLLSRRLRPIELPLSTVGDVGDSVRAMLYFTDAAVSGVGDSVARATQCRRRVALGPIIVYRLR